MPLNSLEEEPSTPGILGHRVPRWHQRCCREAPSGFSPLRTPGPIQPNVTETEGEEKGSVLKKEGIAWRFFWGGGNPHQYQNSYFPFLFGSHLPPFFRSRSSPTIQWENFHWKGGQVRNGCFAVGSHRKPASDKLPEAWGSCVLLGQMGLLLSLSAPSQLGPIQLRRFLWLALPCDCRFCLGSYPG